MENLKLTTALIDGIMAKKLNECTMPEIRAVSKLMGFDIKERVREKNNSGGYYFSFEVHSRDTFVIEISGDTSTNIVSCNNFFRLEMGLSMSLANMSDMLLITMNMFVAQFRIRHEGPQYIEDRDREYDSVEEMSELLEHLKTKFKD